MSSCYGKQVRQMLVSIASLYSPTHQKAISSPCVKPEKMVVQIKAQSSWQLGDQKTEVSWWFVLEQKCSIVTPDIRKQPQTSFLNQFNPILTGGRGGQFDPPCTKSTTAADRDTPFHEFFLSRLTHLLIPTTKFAKIGSSVARSHDVLYSHVGTKFAQNLHFAYVCVQNTWKLLIKQCLFCLFDHLHNFLYLDINQDQITTNKKNHKNNEIHKK